MNKCSINTPFSTTLSSPFYLISDVGGYVSLMIKKESLSLDKGHSIKRFYLKGFWNMPMFEVDESHLYHELYYADVTSESHWTRALQSYFCCKRIVSKIWIPKFYDSNQTSLY